jgi:hypothetical protein
MALFVRPRIVTKGSVCVLACSFFGLLAFALPRAGLLNGEKSISIHAVPIAAFEIDNPSRQRFGSLVFRGGLVLTSSERTFGGLSALRVQQDGALFVACSDRALWLSGRIVYRDCRPAGIVDATLSPVLDADGLPASRWDTDSMAEDRGTLYVGLERVPGIMRFDYGEQGLLARGQPIAVPPELDDLPKNQGLEALAFVPKEYQLGGTLIALSERGLTAAGDIRAFLIGGPTPGSFAVKRIGEYDITDAAMLPGGDLLILERFFSPERNLGMRIRRIPLSEIKPGALVDGPALIEADTRFQIDNMEALSVHRTGSGETRLTLMSDDNFFPLQRTLLLQFALPDE